MLLANRVKYWAGEGLGGADPVVWVELEHAPDKGYDLGAGLWEEALQFVAVLLLANHTHVVQSCLVGDE